MSDVLVPGSRWRSMVCDTEVVVVRPGDGTVPDCGGVPMVPFAAKAAPKGEPALDARQGSQLGKRYADDDSGLELLCTKAGEGGLGVSGRPLLAKQAKKLPSSD